MEYMKKNRRGIRRQIAILFALGVLVIGIQTFLSQRSLADLNVSRQTVTFAEQVADETTRAVKEYPSYNWLIRYWHNHPNTMDIEYDADYTTGTATLEKCRLLRQHVPELEIKYATEADIAKLNIEDQKLYAEICYSWLITRVDQIKQSYGVDYLFCVLTNTNFEKQYFLFSGADPGSIRGTNYEEVYTLGVNITVSESQKQAMENAVKDSSYLADAGDYMDYYSYVDTVNGDPVLIGMTYSLASLRAAERTMTINGTVASVLFLIILSLICLGLITGLVLKPLKTIQDNIRSYQSDKDSKAVKDNLASVHPDNEIGELSEDIVALTQEIDQYIAENGRITAEKERISTELDMAQRIQASMLPGIFPAFPDRHEFDVYATMEPAKEVGGDFYDFFLIDNDHLALVISDVSGKGVPAALFMMISKIILQSCAMLGQSPADILTKTNEAICSNNELEMFVTIWVGILEISTGRLLAANAGHEYPAILRAGKQFDILKDRHGFVIGGMDNMKYRQYEIQMNPGDKLFLYTDGITEAMDPDKKMFGTSRLIDALNEAKDASPDTILKTVRESIRVFVKDTEQFDDMTMLCLEYSGPDKQTN
ncbi:MAG: PP2C family protein-serine/threonine phosphatase [Solobacterium sp.]|nr:PP2C family protein-serine/threonine phosphatase [Solobacterium sp.]